jgi:acyl-coenzyme A synthetase/AMP-(fatty) acid ligase
MNDCLTWSGLVLARRDSEAPALTGEHPEEPRAFARRELTGFKVLTSWRFGPELPRNASGKVLRRALAEQS